ncbi:hypothetical protein, partial [Mesorhizobium sp. M7A.F.Ca.CA.001.06.1.1]|uniref:hypothetical protein n=1 Tax=Mesorhizobium sp. M7A.F.Ca.CA.001.06.1.1 TaxID=2496682 RepID=UPI0019CFBE6F
LHDLQRLSGGNSDSGAGFHQASSNANFFPKFQVLPTRSTGSWLPDWATAMNWNRKSIERQ